jgi:hypothetical protein
MRLGLSIFGCGAVLLVLGAGAFPPDLQAQGMQRSTRSASSSETNSLEIFSTLKGLDEKDDGLKRLDDELAKSLQPFINHTPEPTAPASYQMPRLPVTKNLRSKEDLEKSRGWVWDAEESMSGHSREENSSFSGFSSNSGLDKKRSSWDLYSKEAKTQRYNDSNSRSRSESDTESKSDSEDDTPISGGIGVAAKSLSRTLKGRIQPESVGSVFNPPQASRSSVADFFGLPVPTPPTPAQVEAHKAYIDEYQRIIGGTVLNPVSAEFLKTPVPVLPGGLQNLDTLPVSSSRSDGLALTSGMIPSAAAPPTLPDANANVLNQWNPMYTPPKPELPKPAPFFQPPMDFPRRKF